MKEVFYVPQHALLSNLRTHHLSVCRKPGAVSFHNLYIRIALWDPVPVSMLSFSLEGGAQVHVLWSQPDLGSLYPPTLL